MKRTPKILRRIILILALAALSSPTFALESGQSVSQEAMVAADSPPSQDAVEGAQDSLKPKAPAPAQVDSSEEDAEQERSVIESLRRKIRVARAVLNALFKLLDHELGRLAQASTGI